jgi:hypothetical protein
MGQRGLGCVGKEKGKGLGQLRRRGSGELWKIETLFPIFLICFENQNEFYSNLNISTQLSYPVPRKRERSLHTCAQDVKITCMATIW